MVTYDEHGAVEFHYFDDLADEVYLVGDFNNWDGSATPMWRVGDGEWVATLGLEDGLYQYKFLADGQYALDDAASGVEEVPFGCNSILVLKQSATPALPVG